MYALNDGIKRELVRRVYPDLRFGGDPDVERYFDLRRAGRMTDALSVYNGRLRVRYPDDAARVALLGLFRARDPRYAQLQERLLAELGGRLAASACRNIDLIVRPLETASLGDALGALKAVESVLTRFDGDSERAVSQLSEYAAYARIVGHRAEEVERAQALVREYDAVSRSDAPADYDFVARSEALEERKRAASGGRGAELAAAREESYDFIGRSAAAAERRRQRESERRRFFDPSKIRFTAEERARVEIPAALTRREDKVLAYCAKYWNLARDPAFERTVFLYARKYGTRHYEIFRSVKLGRARNATDDEILSAVSAILSTSYSYSVSGDIYMQVMWRRLRARMDARALAERLATPGPESKVRARRAAAVAAAQPEVAAAQPEAAASEQPPEPRPALRRIEPRAAPPTAAAPLPTRRLKTIPANVRAVERTARIAPSPKAPSPEAPILKAPARKPPSLRAAAPRAPVEGRTHSGHPSAAAERHHSVRLIERPPSGPSPIPELRGSGSISDKIRTLSGKAYDVYKQIFLENAREHIHRALLANPTRPHGIFDTAANEAEDHIYGFLVAHYDDPFMDWGASAERSAVEALGYAMPALDPIIESWFRKL